VRIQKLMIKNFRSHTDTELELDRINIIRGPNGSGKSSIAMAIQFLLTGRCQITDEGGRGADLLINFAQQSPASCAVGAEIIGHRGAAMVMRARGEQGSTVSVNAGDRALLMAQQATSWMHEHLGSIEVLAAVLNSGRFLGLSDKEQKALLASALANEPVAIPEDILAAIKELAMPDLAFLGSHVGSAPQAEAAEGSVRKHRTSLTREIKALGELMEPGKPEDMPDSATVKGQIAGLRSRLMSLTRQKAEAIAAFERTREQLAIARQQLEQFKDQMLADEELQKLSRVAGKAESAMKLQAEIGQLKSTVAEVAAKLRTVEASSHTCQACRRPLDQQALESIEQQAVSLRNQLQMADAELHSSLEKLDKIGDPSEAARKVEAHKKAVIATGSAERLLKEHKNFRDAAPDVSADEKEMAELEQRIGRGEDVLREITLFEGRMQEWKKSADKKQWLTRKVLLAEKVIEAFGPCGPIRAALVGDRMAGFAGRLNETLGHFFFRCEVTLEPFEISVNGRVPRQLSESEAFRFSVAFQIALAEATGIGLVVIDRSDVLLPDVRRMLAHALLESKLDQAIVLVASGHDRITGEPPDGVRFFDIESVDGRSVVAPANSREMETVDVPE